MQDKSMQLEPSGRAKKLAYIVASVMISLIVGNLVVVPFMVSILFTDRLFHQIPDMVAKLLMFMGLMLYIFAVVICFKKLYRYFIKE